jgi:exodeoxyribonuclease V alpha subunit
MELGMLMEIDVHFADLLRKLDAKCSPEVWLAAALTSNATQKGNICLDLQSIAGKVPSLDEQPDTALPACPELNAWREALRSSKVVGTPDEFRPLILDDQNRLYLYRYWRYQKAVADFLLSRSTRIHDALDLPLLQENLDRLFPPQPQNEPDDQRIAALTAARRMFSVITGGPGTGKTSTVVKILVLLLEQAKGAALRIALAAPTGKAAARLKEAVKNAKETLTCSPALIQLIPEESSTLHRLLGAMPHSTRFRFNSKNRLPYGVVVVDEASMIDLPLMAKLVQALPENTRLILLGDKDQLASVQPGAVFGDICDTGAQHSYAVQHGSLIEKFSRQRIISSCQGSAQEGLLDSIATLHRSYRFVEGSGIGTISRLINQGDGEAALTAMSQRAYADISWSDLPSPKKFEQALESFVLQGYGPYLRAVGPKKAFEAFGRFRILCALRHGPCGVEAVNQAAMNILMRAHLISPNQRWYQGRPVLITENDYQMRLFNGDIGIVLQDQETKDASPEKRVFFPTEAGEFRKILPLRLPEHDTVYAMTVHKSQGSEFERVLLLLPPVSSDVLTRELIYTGITRAKKGTEIWGAREVFLEAVSRRTARTSGLRDALWKA